MLGCFFLRLRLRGLSRIPAFHNFLLHWLLTLLVMWGCARFESWPAKLPLDVTSSVPQVLSDQGVVRRERVRSKRDRSALEPDTEV